MAADPEILLNPKLLAVSIYPAGYLAGELYYQ